jgi:cytochrome c553
MKRILVFTLIAFAGAATSTFAADAKANWDDNCAKCHGPAGKGDTNMGKKLHIKDLTDATVQAAFTDAEAFKAVKEGLQDKDGKTRMKAIEGLSDEEITALVQHVRSLKQ